MPSSCQLLSAAVKNNLFQTLSLERGFGPLFQILNAPINAPLPILELRHFGLAINLSSTTACYPFLLVAIPSILLSLPPVNKAGLIVKIHNVKFEVNVFQIYKNGVVV
jgi:hypothetical protein